jgi:hypothetical protein
VIEAQKHNHEKPLQLNAALELLTSMLNVAENCDETGYADGVGFVDIDKLHSDVRAALAAKEGSK